MVLTPRLKTIADSIVQCDVMADIGSDHAYLPIYLIKNNKVKKAVASDINKGPVEIAKKRVKANNAEGSIEVRKGNGLEILQPGEADIIVIAGMGGKLIIEIMTAGLEVANKAKRLILQPMRDSDKVRRWLYDNEFIIIDEELVKEDHKIYEIIWAKPKGNEPAEVGVDGPMYIGKALIEKKHPLVTELIGKRVKEYQDVIEVLKQIDSQNSRERLDECMRMRDYYLEVEHEILK